MGLGLGKRARGGGHEYGSISEKMLSRGNHREGDHRGGCPPSLRSSFKEVCIHVRSVGSGRVLMWAI